MAPNLPFDDCNNNPPANTTVVAIDRDKNSQYAVRWAIDHLVLSNPIICLLHVKSLKNNANNQGSSGSNENGDMHQLFVPYRGYCARKGIQLKEVIYEENDVAKALLDYISKHLISNIVVGAASKNAFTRPFKFRPSDVPTTVLKAAPEFCSVYVISKGKVASVRAAQRPPANTLTPPKAPLTISNYSDGERDDAVSRGSRARRSAAGSERMSMEDQSKGVAREKYKHSGTNTSFDCNDVPIRGPRSSASGNSISSDMDIGSLAMGSLDMSANHLDFSFTQETPTDLYPQSSRDIETEMRRLKLELKQTMDMYSTACKEALTAKKKASELNQWKMEESRRVEEARNAEEAALAVAEMEKAKCRAAMEAAGKAQKIAEMEAQRRKQAEMKALQEAEEKDRALTALAHNDVRYRKYTIEEIEEATGNFAASNKVGEGGYGPVYKGKLDHTPVAIKVLRPDAAQGKKQFNQEVEVLSCIRHPHMVLLLGACPEFGCLVYEYMSQGSLEDRLFRRGNTPPLSWRKRFQIAAEIATALLFLHQAKPEPLVHRDLKPANILLDQNYVSKISDVGLARLVPPSVANSVTQYHMTSAAGTFCYIDPEYQQTGMLTTKSDIYSLGIMFLQIITAKSPMGLTHHVSKAIEKGTFAEMLDQSVTDWPVEEALSFAKLCLKCSELRKKDRPDLCTEIVPELNRLRDLGKETEFGNNGGYHHSRGSSHGSIPRVPGSSSMTSSASQEEMNKASAAERE